MKRSPQRKVTAPSERQIHFAVVQMVRRAARPDVIWFHPSNGEHRSKATGGILKLMGVVPGIPDLCFVLEGGRTHFLELKRPGGGLSAVQRLVRIKAINLGTPYAVAHDLDEAEQILRAWGVLKHSNTTAAADREAGTEGVVRGALRSRRKTEAPGVPA